MPVGEGASVPVGEGASVPVADDAGVPEAEAEPDPVGEGVGVGVSVPVLVSEMVADGEGDCDGVKYVQTRCPPVVAPDQPGDDEHTAQYEAVVAAFADSEPPEASVSAALPHGVQAGLIVTSSCCA